MHRLGSVLRQGRTPRELQHLTSYLTTTALAAAQACSRRHYQSHPSIRGNGVGSSSQRVAQLGLCSERGVGARHASCICRAVTTAARHVAHYDRAAWCSSASVLPHAVATSIGVGSSLSGMRRWAAAVHGGGGQTTAALSSYHPYSNSSSSAMLGKSSSPFRLYSTTVIRRVPSETSSARVLGATMHTAAVGRPSRVLLAPKSGSSSSSDVNQGNAGAVDMTRSVTTYREEKEDEEQQREEEQEDPFGGNSGPGYLPFRPPFHTINIIMILFIANIISYFIMRMGDDDWRDWMVEHFTISHENWTKVYPLFTNALYQENLFQLLIDCWLLWQFGETMLNFIGNLRLTFLATLCTVGGGLLHVARQKFELYHGLDELEVRGRCYGPNTFIMGLIAVEGLVFRHLNFIQQPPVPFLVLTAFVMVIDVWRIFTTTPTEHGSATGGALVAYLFWALPTRALGLDKLTAAL